MWEPRIESLKAYRSRIAEEFGLQVGKKRAAKRFRCTLDHYIPAAQGGTIGDSRNTALCADCNQKRGQQPFPEFVSGKP